MKKVGIIGAGVSGLACAYELTKQGIEPVLYDQDAYTGGRIEYCVSLTTPGFQPSLYELVEELGLEEAKIPFPPSLMAMLKGKEFLPYENLQKMIEQLPAEEKKYWGKLMKDVMGHPFDPKKKNPRLEELGKISFREFLEDCPMGLRKKLIEPMMIFTFMDEMDLSRISAEYGLFQLRFGMEMGKGGEVYSFEENVKMVTNVLEKKVRNAGAEVNLSSEIVQVEKVNEGFKMKYEHLTETGEEKVQNIVFATPLSVTNKLLPQLDTGKGISYENTTCQLVKGETKTDKKVVMGLPNNPANIRFFFKAYEDEHQIYPMNPEKPIDFDFLYKNYELQGKREVSAAFPLMEPGARIPELNSNIEGAYLSGDFYNYPTLEASIRSGKKVSKLISEN